MVLDAERRGSRHRPEIAAQIGNSISCVFFPEILDHSARFGQLGPTHPLKNVYFLIGSKHFKVWNVLHHWILTQSHFAGLWQRHSSPEGSTDIKAAVAVARGIRAGELTAGNQIKATLAGFFDGTLVTPPLYSPILKALAQTKP